MAEKKSSLPRKIISVILAALILAYAGYQLITVWKGNLDTDYAVAGTAYRSVSADAVAVRAETVLSSEQSGVTSYLVTNGEKVAAGSVIANTFSNEEAAQNYLQLTQLNQTIAELQKLQSSGSVVTGATDKISTQLAQKIDKLVAGLDTGKLRDFDELSQDVLSAYNTKQMATGYTVNFTERIAQLTAQRDALSASASSVISVIKTPSAGYFISAADGYEDLVTPQSIKTVSVSEIKDIITGSKPAQVEKCGKIFTGYDWYFAALLSADTASEFSAGQSVTVTVPAVSSAALPCEVSRVQTDYSLSQTLVVLKCSEVQTAFLSMRCAPIQIRLNQYSGIKLKKSALRVVDGITGVYIVSGVQAKFVAVNVLYSDDQTVICKYDPSVENRLGLYDEVIINGSDLYDGKIIK